MSFRSNIKIIIYEEDDELSFIKIKNFWGLHIIDSNSESSLCKVPNMKVCVLTTPLEYGSLLMAWESRARWQKTLSPCTCVEDLGEAPGSRLTQLWADGRFLFWKRHNWENENTRSTEKFYKTSILQRIYIQDMSTDANELISKWQNLRTSLIQRERHIATCTWNNTAHHLKFENHTFKHSWVTTSYLQW